MADGRSRQLWGIAASQMALLANLHRDPHKTRRFVPRDFDPHAIPARDTPVEKVSLKILKVVFCR